MLAESSQRQANRQRQRGRQARTQTQTHRHTDTHTDTHTHTQTHTHTHTQTWFVGWFVWLFGGRRAKNGNTTTLSVARRIEDLCAFFLSFLLGACLADMSGRRTTLGSAPSLLSRSSRHGGAGSAVQRQEQSQEQFGQRPSTSALGRLASSFRSRSSTASATAASAANRGNGGSGSGSGSGSSNSSDAGRSSGDSGSNTGARSSFPLPLRRSLSLSFSSRSGSSSSSRKSQPRVEESNDSAANEPTVPFHTKEGHAHTVLVKHAMMMPTVARMLNGGLANRMLAW